MRPVIGKVLERGMVAASALGAVIDPLSAKLFPETLEIDENVSLWAKNAQPYTANSSLQSSVDVDVAVIGGGFTGVSTCYYISRREPHKRVVLLEAKSLANGASGRSAGLMLNWLVDQADYGEELLKPIYDLTSGGMREIIDIISRHSLPVRYRTDGTHHIYTDNQRAESAHAHVVAMNRVGVPLAYLSESALKSQLLLQGAKGAVFDPHSGQLNGLEYVRALKPVLESQGVQIFENTPVLKLTDGSEVLLETPNGTVRAKVVVLATNAYTGKLGVLRDAFFPLHSFVFATEKLTAAQQEELGWRGSAGFSDDLDRISYSAMTTDGHLLFGGGSNATYQYRFGNRTSAALDTPYARRGFDAATGTWRQYMPQASSFPISARWSGVLDLTLRRNLIINRIGINKNILYALGFCGHGVVLSNIAAQVLADMYVGEVEKWRRFPFFEAQYSPLAPEPFRWAGYQLFTRLTGRSPRV